MLLHWILAVNKNIKRSSILWNAIGGAANACQSAIILIFVSHKLGIVTAGIVTIAYAVANLFMTMGKYGMRNYQVTDVNCKFSFGDYFYSRLIINIVVIIMAVLYLALCLETGRYSNFKICVIFEVIILKIIDGFEDVYIGRYQQVGRLDAGAKIMAMRLILSTVLMCILIVCGLGIHIALMGGIISSVLMDIYFIKGTFYFTKEKAGDICKNNILQLIKTCFPLCVGTTLSVYIGNAPKYMIDNYMNEEIQAIFGYIMMPVFVIMLLNNFIYQPMVKELGDLWEARDYETFKAKNIRQCLMVVLLMVFVLLAGITVGLPILSWMYNSDLTKYRLEFAVLLIGGGFYALAFYLNVPITTIRKHKYIAIGYAIAALLSFIAGKYFAVKWGILGAAYLYLLINVFLVGIYTCVLIVGIKKEILKNNLG